MTDTEIEQLAEKFLEKMKRASNRWEAGVHLWTGWALVEAFKAGAQLAAPVAAKEPVTVCPFLDRECGDYKGAWCATCPKARKSAQPAPGERKAQRQD